MLLSPLGPQFFHNDGTVAAGGLLHTYVTGTTTDQLAYQTQAGTAHTNPIVLDTAGKVQPALWLLPSVEYRYRLETAAGVLIDEWDDIYGISEASLADLASTSDVTKGDALVGVKTTKTGAVATDQHQVNEERTSAFQFMTSAQIAAILDAAGAAGAECSTALQSAIDELALASLPAGRYMIGTMLRVVSGTDRVSIRGDNRIRCILSPSVTSLSAAPASVNAMLMVQDNNAHFCMENVRFFSSNAYTGIGIYCKEGGGSDATGQALFSGVFRNLWIDFASTNTGFLTGAVQNTVFDTVTAENMKGLFTLEGVGNADNHFRNFSLFNCYDQFILQTADTNGSLLTSISGLHAYTHQRGRLIDVQNWIGGNITDVILEPATGNLGSTGLFKFKDCVGQVITNFSAETRSGVPECAVCIDIDGATRQKYAGGFVNAGVGLRFIGTGAVDLVFENVDFTECSTAAMQINAATTGRLITRGCKFNDSTISGILSSVSNALNWYSYDDEFLNAGLGGSASARNITLASSGEVILNRPRIGQNNGSAAAAYFIDASGSGTVTLVDPIWVGAPPSGRTTGAQAVTIKITQPAGVAAVTDATYTVAAGDGAVVADRAGTVTLTLPAAGDFPGRRVIVKTHQAQAVVSASSNVVPRTGGSAGTAILAATDGAMAELISDGSNWQTFAAA